MFKKVFGAFVAAFVLLGSQIAQADDQGSFATLFQRAMTQGKTGNGFVAGPTCSTAGSTSTCTSPSGGTVTQNYAQWNGSSGTTTWSYNNFTISVSGITMTLNGSFTYTGSVSQGNILNGTLTGNLAYNIVTPAMVVSGYTIPAMNQNMTIGINATFANGGVTANMTIDGKAQPTITWSQTQLLGYLY
ncbi:MAG: hypothetical protein KGZ83_10680 [Sulfuricella sp.]|nr:hypothetical protein [Sulfuricella sp.]